MEKESKYGPQDIWKGNNVHMAGESDDESREDEEDIYDKIQLHDDESTSDGDGDNSDNSNNDDRATGLKKGNSGEDFYRPSDAHGVVLDDELRRRKGKARSDFDELALKAYEIRKLKYYFAVVECDSIETASFVYEQLDGMEFEHSSMTFDMRFIPDDVDFKDRAKRDTCSTVPVKYEAPDFIINALQHTDIKCTWDENDNDREKLTNLSKWRQYNESDFQQYLASSDSDSDNSDKAGKKKYLRNMLLGKNNSDDDDDDDHNSEEKDVHDDFFIDDSNASDNENGNEKTFTFVPEDVNTDNTKREQETPFEATLRKLAEKKKKRKLAKKEFQRNLELHPHLNVVGNDQNKTVNNEALELMFDNQDNNASDDYDMRKIAKFQQEQLSGKKKKSKYKKKSRKEDEKPAGLDFRVDMTDKRFSNVFDGSNEHFGIDRTSSEFKDTENMRDILKEQRRKRALKSTSNEKEEVQKDISETTKLVSKLKRKFEN